MSGAKLRDFWNPFTTRMKNAGVDVSSVGRRAAREEHDVPVGLLDSFNLLERGDKRILVRVDYPENPEWYEERGASPAEDALFRLYRIEDGEVKEPWTYYYENVKKAGGEAVVYLTGQTKLTDF